MLPVIAIASLFSISLGGLFAIRMRDRLHLMLGFSAGSVTGVALLCLLPEAMGTGNELTPLIIAGGFVAYLVMDRLFSIHSHDDGDCDNPRHDGRFGASALWFHSLVDGIAIGIAFRVSGPVGLSVSIAILAHQFSDGINVVNMILRGGGPPSESYGWLAILAITPMAGIVIGSSVLIPMMTFTYIIPVLVGTFLYIGVADLLPESHHAHPTVWTTVATIVGMTLIYAVTAGHRF